jgi:cytochrome P450
MITYDTLSTAFRSDRAGLFRKMRDDEPVHVDEHTGMFTLTRFDDVQAAATDWHTYSSAGPWGNPALPRLNDLDPPDHTALRDKVSLALTTDRMLGMEADLRMQARALMQDLVARGECDLVADYIRPCVTSVAGRLFGLSDDQAAECLDVTDILVRAIPGEPVAEPTPQERLPALFFPIMAARRQAPGDDLISALVAVGADGSGALTDAEIFGFVVGVFVPLLGPSPNAIGNGMALLGAHPDQRADLAGNPALTAQAFEEMMRCEPPTHDQVRLLTHDVTLHGVTMPAGSTVRLLWAAANRDERAIDDPERFDIHRTPPQQLSFGHGIHACIGSALARLEARVLIEELLAAAPDYEIVEVGPRIRSNWVWGHESLTVSLA